MPIVRSDPFREIDHLAHQLLGARAARPFGIPMDAYKRGEVFVILLDLPGVEADAIELTVEDNVLTVRADRPALPSQDPADTIVSERPHGVFARQVFLGDNLDTEHIDAAYEAGVLTLSIPMAAHAKSRRIEVTRHDTRKEVRT